MILLKEKKFIAANFANEREIEKVVEANAEYIFGPDSIYLPKMLIKSPDGIGTIPDGFAIDLASRQWYIVEAELSSHSVWNHIAPQVAKQIIAASQPSTRAALIELVVNLIKNDDELAEKIDELEIEAIDIRQVLTEIFEKKPIVGLPIDAVSLDLKEWAQTLKVEVKLWIVRKLVDFNDSTNILYEIPDEFKPVFDTTQSEESDNVSQYFSDVTVVDLIERGFLKSGDKLSFTYKPRGGTGTNFIATVLDDGSFQVQDKVFSSPSYAATFCMQQAGSQRKTINGWSYWKNANGSTLAQLRLNYISKTNPSAA
jgi:hypothetical protein